MSGLYSLPLLEFNKQNQEDLSISSGKFPQQKHLSEQMEFKFSVQKPFAKDKGAWPIINSGLAVYRLNVSNPFGHDIHGYFQ